MNVIVCVKQVPDPNAPGQLDPQTKRLRREGVDAVLDPGDEYGVEAGLQLIESHEGELTLVSMGPERAIDALRKGLAMGAHKAIQITDSALAGADALTTARVLAAAISRQPFDLVITATESTDGYTGVVPQAIAELLGVPAVTFAKSISIDGSTLRVDRQTETGIEVIEAQLPAVISVTAGVNEPRYPSLKGIMGAKQKPLENLLLADLGLGEMTPANQEVVSVVAAAARKAGEVIQDDGAAAERIAEFLSESKVI